MAPRKRSAKKVALRGGNLPAPSPVHDREADRALRKRKTASGHRPKGTKSDVSALPDPLSNGEERDRPLGSRQVGEVDPFESVHTDVSPVPAPHPDGWFMIYGCPSIHRISVGHGIQAGSPILFTHICLANGPCGEFSMSEIEAEDLIASLQRHLRSLMEMRIARPSTFVAGNN